MINGEIWKDNKGSTIHAHGGCIIKWEDYFFWYGENRTEDIYVSCYSSKDLINWTFENNVLTAASHVAETRVRADLSLRNKSGGKVNIERPKVLYNKKTEKFVMWMHYENGMDYNCAAAAIAVCDTPAGDFIYYGSFRPYGYMSRDCTLFQDNDGQAYFLSASRDNADMHMYLLQDDYMNVERIEGRFWQGEYREAPAMVKNGGLYYILSSFCTGWAPNQCKYAKTNNIKNGFGYLTEIGNRTTYHSQPAFILTIEGTEETTYIYVGDRWDGTQYHNSRYVWYPLSFGSDRSVKLIPCEEIYIDVISGKYEMKNKV